MAEAIVMPDLGQTVSGGRSVGSVKRIRIESLENGVASLHR
jgi:hypothetical protein